MRGTVGEGLQESKGPDVLQKLGRPGFPRGMRVLLVGNEAKERHCIAQEMLQLSYEGQFRISATSYLQYIPYNAREVAPTRRAALSANSSHYCLTAPLLDLVRSDRRSVACWGMRILLVVSKNLACPLPLQLAFEYLCLVQ